MSAVLERRDRDDRDPNQVVNDPAGPYHCDQDAWLRDMAISLDLDLNAIPEGCTRAA